MSSAGVVGLSATLLLSMLCSNTHVNTMSLTTFAVNQYSKTVFHHPPAPGYPVVSYSLLSGQLSSAVDQPRHQDKGIVPQQKVV